MAGEVQWSTGFMMVAINIFGLWVALRWLNRERPKIPFLI